jgi:hypothetical protein
MGYGAKAPEILYVNTTYEISHPTPNSATLPVGKEPKRQARHGCKEEHEEMCIPLVTRLCSSSQAFSTGKQ